MKSLSYCRWISAEFLFMISIMCSVLFGAYAMPIQLANHLGSTQLAILSGTFFAVFAFSQLYSGYLINKISTKLLLGVSALLAAGGVFLFANTHTFSLLMIARVIIGLGLGCTFVGVLYVVEMEFNKQFAFFASLSQSVGNVASGLIAIFGSSLISFYSYQIAYNIIGFLLIVAAVLIFIFLPNKTQLVSEQNESSLFKNLKIILLNKRFIAATIYFAGIFATILAYADLFNVQYREVIFQMSSQKAIILNGMIPLGIAIGGVIAGSLSTKYKRNRLIAASFSLLLLVSMIVTLYVRFPTNEAFVISSAVQLLFGIGCGGGMLAFQEVQVAFKDVNLRSLGNSLVLTIAYLFAGLILQPGIGMIIGNNSYKLAKNSGVTPYTLLDQPIIQQAWHHYNLGLSVLVVILAASFISSLFFTAKIK
ncbi:MAG: MFS transporter [Amoebophilaceae bacterium]|nr:MFS transporter [Amoebophilaceae bacterium]